LKGATLKLYIVLNAQQIWYALVAKPDDAVPKLNVSWPAPVAGTSKVCPVYGAGTDAPEPHTELLATTRALFVFANPVPDTCTLHGTVIGQLIVPMVSGPWSVKSPISKE
jgi:hypothetical protein